VLAAAEAEPTAATLSSFWPTWLADASGRLAEQTLDDYEGTWGRRIEVRFGDVALGDITPRMPDSRPGGSCRSAVPRSSATSRGRTSGWASRIGPRPW
jgi:hypothetical protein